MKKLTASIFSAVLMLSMVFSSSVFAANDATQASAWESFVGLFTKATTTATTANVQYRGHVEDYGDVPTNGTWVTEDNQLGTTGESKRIEGFKIELTDGNTLPAGTQIRYNVHIQNEGWQHNPDDIVNTSSWAKNGEFAGSVAKSQRVEAIEIVLTDANGVKLEGYSVQYMVHVENIGWDQGWVSDGALAGTTAKSYRLEAIRIKIVQTKADLTQYNAALAAKTQADYTTASWTTYQAVVNANKVTDANTQTQVNTATANITAAQGNLVLVPKVTSVTALNANQVQVTFSTPIKASSIISNTTTGALQSSGTGYFTIKRSTDATNTDKNVTSFATGFLSTDGKVLTLTATSPKYFDGTYALTVTDQVKTTADTKLTAYSGTFTYTDTVAPTVTNLGYNTITGNIEATLSEPIVDVPSIIRVNGTPLATTATFVDYTNHTKVQFAKPSSVLAGTTATVYLAGATDYALNQLTGYTGNVAITSDASAVAVQSVTQSGSNVIKVVFNKSIASDNTTVDTATTVMVDGVTTNNTVVKDTTDTQNKTFLITVPGADAAPKYFYGSTTSKTLVVTFASDSITDVFGQKLATSTNSVVMTKDTAGPVATSVKASDDGTTIEVTFDENISATTDKTQITLRKDGVALDAVASATKKAATGDDAKVLVITPNASSYNSDGVLPAGSYTIRLNAATVSDLNTINNLAQNLTLAVTGTATKLTASITNAGGADNKFLISYDKDVTSATALNLANYTLDGAALPSGTDIYFTNGFANRKVEIDLPSESINVSASGSHTYASLAVSNVVSADSITVTPVATNVYVLDNTKPVLQSAKMIDNKTIELTYNEDMYTVSGAAVDDEFVIKQAGSVFTIGSGNLQATNVSGYPTKVRVTVDQGTDTPASVGSIAKTNANGATLAAPSGTFTGTANVQYKVKVVTVDTSGTFDVPATWAISTDNGATYGAPGTSTNLGNGLTLGSFTVGTANSAIDDTFSFTATAATSALVFDLNKTTTIGTIETAGTANMKDLASNIQKVDVTVTAN